MGEGILLRSADLVVMGVRWEGMSPVAGAAAGPPELVAGSSGGRLVVTLPPQHVAEAAGGGGLTSPGMTQSIPPEPPVTCPPGAFVGGASTDRHTMQIFVAGDDGRAHVNVWHDNWDPVALVENPQWEGWRPLPGVSLPPGAPIAALLTGPGTIGLYAVGTDGGLWSGTWTAEAPAVEWKLRGGGGPPVFTADDVAVESWGFWFAQGAAVEAVLFAGVPHVFALDESSPARRLLCWRDSGGWLSPQSPRRFQPGARFTAVSCSFSHWESGSMATEAAVFVFAVDGEGRVTCDRWDGGSWASYELGSPPSGLPPLAPVGAVDSGSGEVYVVAVSADGGLWGMRWRWLDPPAPVGTWQRIGEGYLPAGSITALRRDMTPLVLAVDATGVVVETTLGPANPDGLLAFHQREGDWFPPGSPVGTLVLGQSSDALLVTHLVQADRTVVPGHDRQMEELQAPWSLDASLSGPSQLAVTLPRDARVTLTSEGVLAALRDWPVATVPAGFEGPAGDETVLELPWGLFLSPEAGHPAHLRHSERPREADRIVELWHTSLGSQPQGVGDDPGPSLLRPAWARSADPRGTLPTESDPLFTPALSHLQRTTLVREARGGPPISAERAMLSALGGWLEAAGSWPGFAWQHEAAGGRDVTVRTVTRGIVFPFGHAAQYEQITRRVFDERGERSVASLYTRGTLEILEPVRSFGDDGSAFREFPFREVEIVQRSLTLADAPVWMAPGGPHPFFRPAFEFPVRLRGPADELLVRMPLIFVQHWSLDQDADPAPLADVQAQYGSVRVDVPGVSVALAADQRFELHALELGPAPLGARGAVLERGLRPRIASARVALPALRRFAPDAAPAHDVTLDGTYVEHGDTDVLLRLAGGASIPVDFGGRSDVSGGVATPGFVADAISGAGAPIKPDALDPASFFKDAKLLGVIPLPEVLHSGSWKPPLVRSEPEAAGLPPKVVLDWNDVELTPFGVFEPLEGCRLALNVTSTGAPPRVTTTGTLGAFKLDLAGVLVLTLSSLTFASNPDEKPTLKVAGLDVAFAGDLQFLNVLQDAMRTLQGTMPVAIDASPTSITITEHAELPSLSLGAGVFAVTVSGAVLTTALKLPFDGEMEVDFSFGSRKHPFRVGVWILGGGGYLELKIARDPQGAEFVVRGLAAAVEIGGVWSLDWVVVKGEVHALAGIEIGLNDAGRAHLSGYVRVGGSVEALGLVSVSIEVTAEITVDDTEEAFLVQAAASVVIEVDLFLVSAPLELHQTIVLYEDRHGPREIEGRAPATGRRTFDAEEAREAWREYRQAFAPAAA